MSKTGDNKANLIMLMNRIASLGFPYKMWENRKSRKLALTMSQALDGQVRDDWQEVIGEQDDWDHNEMKEQFINCCKILVGKHLVQMLTSHNAKSWRMATSKSQKIIMKHRNLPTYPDQFG